jgi:hypothetical protein
MQKRTVFKEKTHKSLFCALYFLPRHRASALEGRASSFQPYFFATLLFKGAN